MELVTGEHESERKDPRFPEFVGSIIKQKEKISTGHKRSSKNAHIQISASICDMDYFVNDASRLEK
jgi:hypothetical protein